MAEKRPRTLRADALRNETRLLEAAARAFARDGADASLKAVAQDAGVGIGTLYRRFPTREALVEATYRNETERLCAAATVLVESTDPRRALRQWMDRFTDFMATKHGMSDALKLVLQADGQLRTSTRDLLADAIATLVTAGVEAGQLRPDVPAEDVLMALGGIMLIAGEPAQRALAGRLLDLLVDGLEHR
jgi:AcrR family transcriptional regulator